MIVAARIYADVPNNLCSCGGKFTKRISHPFNKETIIPTCDRCNGHPLLYLVDVDGLDKNNKKKRFKIRNSQNNERLTNINKVTFTIDTILKEIKDGSFNVEKYESKESKKHLIFKNYVATYLKFQDLRLKDGQITPKGHLDKCGLIKREVIPFFGEMDITTITKATINLFKESFMGKDKDRTRDLALGELKTILRRACGQDLIVKVPLFDPIKRAKTRTSIISLELAIKTVALMHKQIYRDMYAIMLTYPIRPCEIRSLKWTNINFDTDEFTIDHHFSDETLIKGRKSIKDGEMATMTYPMGSVARDIFLKYLEELDNKKKDNWKEQLIFINSYGNHVSGESLRDAWTNAKVKAGHSFHAYECRHAIGTDIYQRSGGDLIATSKAFGHTTTTMTAKHYLRPEIDKRKLYNV